MSDVARDTEKFDWQGVESAAVAQIVTAVRRVRAEYPDEHVYGAMFHEFYGDGSVIDWPRLSVGTEETLAQVLAESQARYAEEGSDVGEGLEHTLRWSGPDLEMVSGGPGTRLAEAGEIENAWAERCQTVASAAGGFAAWEKVYDRFLRIFPRAAKRARTELLREGVVGKDFIAIAADEAGELIPLSLTKTQLSRHFPEYDEQAQERARLATLPVAERLAELLPQVMGTAEPGPLIGEYDALVRQLGEAAVPALLDVVTGRTPGEVCQAIMLLAEINHSTPEVIAALERVMIDPEADESTRAWAASALARFDRMDLIARHAVYLPVEVAARGLAGPFTSFRDDGNHRPLDYGPLEAVLSEHPELANAVAHELRVHCSIDASEVPAARAGLASQHAFIREHARSVLEEWEER